MPSDNVEQIRPDEFPELTKIGDPALRLVAWLIRSGDFRQLEQRTGIRVPPKSPSGSGPEVRLPVVIRLDAGQFNAQAVDSLADRFRIPIAYRDAMKDNTKLKHATARLLLGRANALRGGSVDDLSLSVKDLRAAKATHVSLGAPGRPFRKRSELAAINVPDDRIYNNKALSGEGVVVGIIDDGCALAHADFLKPRAANAAAQSRILHLWDQGGAGNPPPEFLEGVEFDKAAIDQALAANTSGGDIDEEAVYRDLGYPIREVATHGTHVMGIAAGNGQSVMGAPGVAPGADIIFVQLPASAIEGGATVLWQHVLDGARYILARAPQGAPVVINISYGGHDGPHDGTSRLEVGLDEMAAQPDRAIVLAAGNGFEARCHASADVPRNGTASLRWIIGGQDPTANTVEFWYDNDNNTTELHVRFSTPGVGIDPAGWIPINQSTRPITRTSDGKQIGFIEHLPSITGNNANCIVLSLNATHAAAANGADVPAPPGTWTIEFKHVRGKKATVHGWIWRDDAGRPRNARVRQSRFHPDDASPEYSIGGWATGQRTISVGAFNAATEEVCRYSACGPTRDGRNKPEIYAPAEDDVRGRGVLSASARSARPTRMNGTSAAAPYITGMIALMFHYAQKHAGGGPVHLTADQIRNELRAAHKAGKLRDNRRQAIDKRIPPGKKQKDVRARLLSTERADFIETMKKLPQ